DRDLAGEFDEALEDAVGRAEGAPDRTQIAVAANADLAFAVITHAHGLEDRARANRLDAAAQLLFGRHRLIGRGADADRAQEVLFLEAVLRDAQRIGAGPHWLALGEEFGCVAGHVLEFERDDIDRFRKAPERELVVVLRRGRERGYLFRRA